MSGLHVGPGPVEVSSISVPEVAVAVAPLQSLLQRELVLHVHARRAHGQLVQASNFSWLGYPQDTSPSSRNLLPGLAQQEQPQVRRRRPSGPGGSATSM